MAEITRDDIQKDAADLWLRDENRFGTLILGTGVGKSLVAMIILNRLFELGDLTTRSKILLLVDSEDLRDNNWKKDFEKWGYSWMWEYIDAQCYQSFYKNVDFKYDLLIADEIDFAITEAYIKSFTKNDFSMVLGLTGYVDPEKREALDAVCPILMEYSTDSAQKDGILNKTQVVFVYYYLSQNSKDMELSYLKGSKMKKFTQSENDYYAYLHKQIETTFRRIKILENTPGIVFGLDRQLIKELERAELKMRGLVNKRKELLHTSKSGVKAARALASKILETSTNKLLIFSQLTDQADRISDHTYHGKNSMVNKSLSNLSKGVIRQCGVCKAVNRGKNLDGVNNLVMESFDGSKTSFRQRHGRGTRLNPDQTMYLYIMLPLFLDKVPSEENPGTLIPVHKPTQAVKWAKEMMSGYQYTHKPIVITKGLGKDEWY